MYDCSVWHEKLHTNRSHRPVCSAVDWLVQDAVLARALKQLYVLVQSRAVDTSGTYILDDSASALSHRSHFWPHAANALECAAKSLLTT